MHLSGSETGRRQESPAFHVDLAVLFVGFVGLLFGIAMAHLSPADGYEVSIYAATPASVWLGLAIAYVAAAVVSVRTARVVVCRLALFLGGLATLVVAALPVLRGYRYHGQSDSLTHLGWVQDLGAGRMSFFDLFYPGTHTMSVFYAETFALSYEAAALLMFVTLAGLYLLFVPLVVRALTGNRRAAVIAAFSGFLFLPITNVSGGMFYHAFTLGVFFFPVLLFLIVRSLLEAPTFGIRSLRISSNGIVLLVSGVALLFVHPQTTLNVLILLGAINAFYLYRWIRAPSSEEILIPNVLVFVTLASAWVLWITQFPSVFITGGNVLVAIEEMILGTGEVGSTVETQGESAATVGGSIAELFLKLFFVASIYTTIAVAVVLASILEWGNIDSKTRSLAVYIGFATAILTPFFFAHFLGDVSHLFFRHVSFGLVLATVFGAVGIFWVSNVLSDRFSRRAVRTFGIALLAIALLLSLIAVFPSPYIYNQNHHVSDYDYDGYESAFAHQDEAVHFSGIRSPPNRFYDALVPGDRPARQAAITEEELLANPAIVRDEDFYLPVSKSDHDREVVAYRELRYSEASIVGLERMEGVHLVQTNGEFTVYYVNGEAFDGDPLEE